MPLLSKYYLPGLAVEDHSIEVPLDWRGTSPAALAGVADPCPSRLASESAGLESDPAFAGERIKLFYRVGRSHAWVTNEFEHDGLHGSKVFRHILAEARDRGELEGVL